MRLITGGTFQGKLAWAKKQYGLTEGWVDGSSCDLEELWTCSGISHFHEYIRRMLEEKLLADEAGAEAFAEKLYRENPEITIVTNELGYGVVPVDRFDREYRELTGRVCTCLAGNAEEVVRVVCGIGMWLKECEEDV